MLVTFRGAFLGIAPTGRRASVAAHSIYDFRDGQLVRERFHFDLAALCDGLGVPVERMQAALREARA
jgi:predicted ester cyclase